MREILFRGMHIGEWVYGYYLLDSENHRIFEYGKRSIGKFGIYSGIIVDPETVGQLRYTNSNGVKYFDGDIYYHAGYGLEVVSDLCELQLALISGNSYDIGDIKGNVHDNEELLK